MSQMPRAKMNIPMCIACVLLCLTLFSMYLTGGLYARYISRDEGEDFARVAEFSVDISSDTENVEIRVEQNQTNDSFSFSVYNYSEVSVGYSVLLTFNKDIPSYVDVTLNGKVGTKPDGADNMLLFENVGALAPNGDKNDNTILFLVNSIDDFLSGASGQYHNFVIDFTAQVKCEQID